LLPLSDSQPSLTQASRSSFWTVFLQASFSFLGTEIVALTAAEAENPRRNVPKAINRVFWRILFLCASLVPCDLAYD